MRIDGGRPGPGVLCRHRARTGQWASSGAGLDLVLCEATYTAEHEGTAGHLSGRQAGEQANRAGATATGADPPVADHPGLGAWSRKPWPPSGDRWSRRRSERNSYCDRGFDGHAGRRSGHRRAPAGVIRTGLHRLRPRIGAGVHGTDPGAVHGIDRGAGASVDAGERARDGSPPSTPCCPDRPASGSAGRRPRASSPAGPRRSSASSAGRCVRCATWWPWARCRSPWTATSSRPTAAPGRRRSAAPTWRCTTP